MDQPEFTQEGQAKRFRVLSIALGASGIGLLGLGAIFLTGAMGGASHHPAVGGALVLVGFSELGLAWFFFNKAHSA